ncbi:MAG TPA: hypothetical protein PK894_06215 [Defluviitoga sp.]|nr:hypothetical protein [Defluviitoga sp.]HOP24906.1 hypothetical protein [Defluviitoga sp.]HPU59961.1 hypothetical protein [Defluviitoga tunisiensis]HPZ29215.1 hypothetical protein [Defluviitoga sp.]HQD63170.1 hypothetical protein [Defluviitoga sp.]
MKKFVVSLLVILSALALFAVTVTPVLDVSGEFGFELLLDESALDINGKLDVDFSLSIPVEAGPGSFSVGFKLQPEVEVGKSGDYDSTKPEDHTHPASFTLKDVLDYIEYKEDAWLLRYEPRAIKLSDYTINQFTSATGALKLGLTKYNLSFELADLAAGEVTPHKDGKLSLPENWILGLKYDLDIGEELKGFAATAFKFEDKENNRFSLQGKLTKSPLPGEETVDLVFALLNAGVDSKNAYRVYVDYAYPVTVDGIKLKPHAYFKAQEGLPEVFKPESDADVRKVIDWPDARKIGAGFDLEANPAPFKIGITDTFTIDFLDMKDLKYSLNLKPSFEYAVTDFKVGVGVPMNFTFGTPLKYTITPNLYTVLGIDNLEVAGNLYYFLADVKPDNQLAYMADVTYTYNVLQSGLHLGNEARDPRGNIVGANDLKALHWYLFLKASVKF